MGTGAALVGQVLAVSLVPRPGPGCRRSPVARVPLRGNPTPARPHISPASAGAAVNQARIAAALDALDEIASPPPLDNQGRRPRGLAAVMSLFLRHQLPLGASAKQVGGLR